MQKEKLMLMDLTKNHLEQIFNWRNQPFIRDVMFNSELIQWENHIKWFESILQNENKIFKVLYYDDVPYGVANFSITDLNNSVGEWGFYIGDKNAPKGMGKALAYMILNFLFEEQCVRKVCAEVLDYNLVSLKFHEKIGFKPEGLLRKQIYKNNRFCDIYLFSIFKEEWKVAREIIEKEIFD